MSGWILNSSIERPSVSSGSSSSVRLAAALLALLGVPAIPLRAQDPGRVPEGAAGTVTLSRTEYDRLLDLAARPSRLPEPAPVPSALTRTAIAARVDGASARATLQIEGEVFRSGTIKLPLLKGATLVDARTATGPLPLVVEGDTHFAFIAGPGPFSATAQIAAPVTIAPGRASFSLAVPVAGSTTASIDLPGEQTEARLSRGVVLERSSASGRTAIGATLDPGTPVLVSWSTRDTTSSAPQRDTRMLAELQTLVTLGEADVRLVTLVDLTVLQGEPTQFSVRLPEGYELTGISGASLERSEERPGEIGLFVANPALRRHQFLVSLERSTMGGSVTLKTTLPLLLGAQRETGEVALEGVGTLDMTAVEGTGLRRMDVRELSPAIVSVARHSLLAAFRYQRTTDVSPVLAVDIKRFANAAVLGAVAERAVSTTLVTSEGRALTEITLWVRNRAQPFVKVALPPAASMLSVEVAGAPAKPVEGKDGTRVPLLRPGFRSDGAYQVSFVYLYAGGPFAKKGNMQMSLPKMDIPISVVEWELFVPDRYRLDRFDGTPIPAALVEAAGLERFRDEIGAGVMETVAVESTKRDGRSPERAEVVTPEQARTRRAAQGAVANAPSANVQSLQRRAAGVLPVRVDVPRAGTSHRFVKPLVLEEEVAVSFRYRRR